MAILKSDMYSPTKLWKKLNNLDFPMLRWKTNRRNGFFEPDTFITKTHKGFDMTEVIPAGVFVGKDITAEDEGYPYPPLYYPSAVVSDEYRIEFNYLRNYDKNINRLNRFQIGIVFTEYGETVEDADHINFFSSRYGWIRGTEVDPHGEHINYFGGIRFGTISSSFLIDLDPLLSAARDTGRLNEVYIALFDVDLSYFENLGFIGIAVFPTGKGKEKSSNWIPNSANDISFVSAPYLCIADEHKVINDSWYVYIERQTKYGLWRPFMSVDGIRPELLGNLVTYRGGLDYYELPWSAAELLKKIHCNSSHALFPTGRFRVGFAREFLYDNTIEDAKTGVYEYINPRFVGKQPPVEIKIRCTYLPDKSYTFRYLDVVDSKIYQGNACMLYFASPSSHYKKSHYKSNPDEDNTSVSTKAFSSSFNNSFD